MLIKNVLLLLIFIFINNYLLAQGKPKYELNFADVFVIKVKFIEKINLTKNYCVYKRGTKSTLYKIEVKKISYCPVNNILDSSSLLQLKFLLVPNVYLDSIKTGDEFLITAMPSTSNNYLALTRFLDIKFTEDYIFFHKQAYLSGLIKCECKKQKIFDKKVRLNLIKDK